ncbi:MAG: hypothetical protein U0736_13750 [Gemmataceae bacterium]
MARATLEGLWPQLAKFNRYSFCKSHSVSYGLIAWQAAYLKAHHPLAFWTAALNNAQGSYPRRVYVEAITPGSAAAAVRQLIAVGVPPGGRGDSRRSGGDRRAAAGGERGDPARRDEDGLLADLANLRRRVPCSARRRWRRWCAPPLDFTGRVGRRRPGVRLQQSGGGRRRRAIRPRPGGRLGTAR